MRCLTYKWTYSSIRKMFHVHGYKINRKLVLVSIHLKNNIHLAIKHPPLSLKKQKYTVEQLTTAAAPTSHML